PGLVEAAFLPSLLEAVLGEDLEGELPEERGERRGQRQLDGVLVDHAIPEGLPIHLQDVAGARRDALIVDQIEGEDDVLGREILAVVPLDPFAEMEGPDGARLIELPALRESRLDLRRHAVHFGETVEDEREEIGRRGLLRHQRVEGPRVRDARAEQDSAVTADRLRFDNLFLGACEPCDRQGERQRYEKHKRLSHYRYLP